MVDRSIVMWLFTSGYLSLSHDLPPTCSVKHTGFRLEAVPLIPGSQLIPQERCQWDKTTQGPHPFLFWGLCACDIYIYIYTHTLFFIVTHAIIIQVGWLVGRSVGWLVERLTAVAVVHRHNLHQQISGSAPETSLLPSPPASGGLLGQKQEQSERNDAKQKKTPHNPKKKPLTS